MKTAAFLGYKRRLRHQESDNLFGWSVFILLLCGFALSCWIGTFYIFTHPEQPFNYQILSKLKKLDPPRRFQLTAAPSGEFLSPEKLLATFGAMNLGQLIDKSNSLLRSYIRNYDHEVTKIPYVTGKFVIIDSFPLSGNTFFGSGMAVLAHSLDVPSVYIEHFYPANSDRVSAMRQVLKTGLGIELRRSLDLSAVIHITSLGEGRLLFSCVPLLYGSYGVSDSGAGFQLEPPKAVNLKAGLPLVKENELTDAEKRFTVYTRASGHREVAAVPSKLKSNLISSDIASTSPLKTEPIESSGQAFKP
ncbi:MAG: hypothetical protein JOY96_06785, partial [Verrucomicrobia bacterium]|nr:hypothetical protein [Verrucomicrobiota bacterium]